MALSKFAPAALIAALAVAAGPLLAQEPPAKPPHPVFGPSIKLDFGAGRKVDIKCGEAAIEACIAAATPLIEKVATTPPVEQGMRGGKGFGKHGWKGGKNGPKGERGGPDGKPPVPPPAEGELPPPPAN